ncbi:MAG: polysaccharide pyruvyl transferase CsaB [Firmicutes bacterium]|nr:polysaccharide pyruvyl transferase CsaB [Bacillota bacterium]
MRIMHFAGGGDIGGAKTHILSLGRELAADNDYLLVSFRKGPFAAEARAMGLKVLEVEKSWNVWECLQKALQAADQFKPDVIHCHGAKANMMAVMVKKLRHIPIITTVHSDPKLDYMGAPLKQYTFGQINAWALRRMDYFMAVAGKMEQNLIERGFNPQRIFTIYNGLDFSQADGAPKPVKKDGDIVVGIAARLTPIKNIPTLLKAFAWAYAKNPRLRLKIAGIGEDEEALKELAKQLEISHRVDFVGWITDMRGFFSQVDINVLSSFSETFPYSLLEGAFEHCAAIASNVGGMPYLIEHGKTGFLFEPEDHQTFGRYIYELSVDDEKRSALAEALFQLAKSQFSLEKMRKDQLAVYETICRRRECQGRYGAVICGAYGRGNAGDDAILQAIVAQLRQIDREMPLTVMTRDKAETRMNYRTNAIYIFNIPAFIRHLRQSKLFINGGGSLIQDVTSSRSLYFYLFTLKMAKLCGCRVIMYGCGIGPIQRNLNKRIVSAVLNDTAETITLRDSYSLQTLEQMHVDKPRIMISADPTVSIARADRQEPDKALALENIPADKPKICFCLRNWGTFDKYQEIAAAAEYAYKQYGLLPVFLPFEPPKDIDAAAKVIRHLHCPYISCEKRYGVEDLIAILGSMEAVVAMRLHALILATCGHTPVVGISYDVKVESFMKDIGSDACIDLDHLAAAKLCAQIDRIAAVGREQAKAAAETLRDKEAVNIQAVRSLLQ